MAFSVSKAATSGQLRHHIGFDLGTSGARISIIQQDPQLIDIVLESKSSLAPPSPDINAELSASTKQIHQVYSDSISYNSSYSDPKAWMDSVHTLLQRAYEQAPQLLSTTKSICVSGTSASCLLVDTQNGSTYRDAKMYDYDVSDNKASSSSTAAEAEAEASLQTLKVIDRYAPLNHVARANTSALSKLLHYHLSSPLSKFEVLAHQSEYVANTVFLSTPSHHNLKYNARKESTATPNNHRRFVSDWHNALKLGYDVQTLSWPNWVLESMKSIGMENPIDILPLVVAPGQIVGNITKSVIERYGIASDAVVVGGTTDSNAAFIAATATVGGGLPKYGTAVTSLGSTLALKMLSRTFVEDSKRGVYSHRFPLWTNSSSVSNEEEAWLVGK